MVALGQLVALGGMHLVVAPDNCAWVVALLGDQPWVVALGMHRTPPIYPWAVSLGMGWHQTSQQAEVSVSDKLDEGNNSAAAFLDGSQQVDHGAPLLVS